uniref:Bm1230, isoform a n=1 Tax=Brugia malayi TaxID=6279 RepID=A0A1I9G6M8_BRUMA|nr:Bm1230, isoform a [Brugia malayi]
MNRSLVSRVDDLVGINSKSVLERGMNFERGLMEEPNRPSTRLNAQLNDVNLMRNSSA